MEELGITPADLVGYIASAAVLISFLMKKMRLLRIVNTVGCGLFVMYGIMLDEISWPIIITNVAIIGVNFYQLFIVKPINE